MKVNVAQQMTEVDGTPLMLPTGEKGADGRRALEPVYLKDIIVMGLGKPEPKLDPKEHVDRFRLAMHVRNASGEIDLKAKDIEKIFKLISEIGYSPLVIGQAMDMIEPEESKC